VTVLLGPIEFDERIIKRQLRRDLLDDWFPDPRRFEDLLDIDHVEAVLVENFQRNEGIFKPEKRTLFNIPKSNFTLRYGLEISLAERALYQALAARLVPLYDPLIPWSVFSHRAAENPDGRYLFRRAIPAWQDFTGVVRDGLGRYEDKFFSTVFLGSGLLFLAMIFVSAGVGAGLERSDAAAHPDVATFGQMVLLAVQKTYALRMAAVFMISLATIWLKTGLMPRWLVGVSYFAAVGLLIASDITMWLTLAFPAWVLMVSILLLVRAGVVDLDRDD